MIECPRTPSPQYQLWNAIDGRGMFQLFQVGGCDLFRCGFSHGTLLVYAIDRRDDRPQQFGCPYIANEPGEIPAEVSHRQPASTAADIESTRLQAFNGWRLVPFSIKDRR